MTQTRAGHVHPATLAFYDATARVCVPDLPAVVDVPAKSPAALGISHAS
jgi:hypothetical protein